MKIDIASKQNFISESAKKAGVSVYIPDMQIPGLLDNGKFDSSVDPEEKEVYEDYEVSFKPKKKNRFTQGTTVTAPSARKLKSYLEDHAFIDDPASVKKYMKLSKKN